MLLFLFGLFSLCNYLDLADTGAACIKRQAFRERVVVFGGQCDHVTRFSFDFAQNGEKENVRRTREAETPHAVRGGSYRTVHTCTGTYMYALAAAFFFAVIVPSLLPYFAILAGECTQLFMRHNAVPELIPICASKKVTKIELHVIVSLWTLFSMQLLRSG